MPKRVKIELTFEADLQSGHSPESWMDYVTTRLAGLSTKTMIKSYSVESPELQFWKAVQERFLAFIQKFLGDRMGICHVLDCVIPEKVASREITRSLADQLRQEFANAFRPYDYDQCDPYWMKNNTNRRMALALLVARHTYGIDRADTETLIRALKQKIQADNL